MENIKSNLASNFNLLEKVTKLIHSVTGEFDELIAYDNDNDFFLTFFEKENPMEIVRQVCSGFYSYYDEYVYFNDGDLTSMTQVEYYERLAFDLDGISGRLVDLFEHIKDGIEDETLVKMVEDYKNNI